VTTPAGTSTNAVAASVNWTHDINPATSLSGSFSYSVSNNGAFLGNPGQSSNLATIQATLSHNFSQSVSGSLDYVYTERSGGALRGLPSNFGGSSTQSLFFASVQKSF
jgi:uncharacterized protein (PEP-CTERM system associated)